LKKTLHTHKKKAGGVAQGIGPEFKPQYHKKIKKKKEEFLKNGFQKVPEHMLVSGIRVLAFNRF
jgi:hypothetical protein